MRLAAEWCSTCMHVPCWRTLLKVQQQVNMDLLLQARHS